jgi:hypothetical protein
MDAIFLGFPLTKHGLHAKMLSCGWLKVDQVPAAILTFGARPKKRLDGFFERLRSATIYPGKMELIIRLAC